jgi:CheY-like chemotaxis protein
MPEGRVSRNAALPARVPSALVADDDAAVRAVLAELLAVRGWRVVTAKDGSAALALARAEAFDIFFVDLRMPGLNGVELATALRGSGCTAPIVLVTADGPVVDDARRSAAGIQRVLSKPFRYEDIVACLDLVRPATHGSPKGSNG